MKFKSLLFVCCLSLFSSAFADTQHAHPQANGAHAKRSTTSSSCEIEIINRSYDDVHVFGVFDDGTNMAPFDVYSDEGPHHVDLFYYGYCHAGMHLYIDTFSGYRIYAGYTPVHSVVDVLPFFDKKRNVQVKVEVKAK